MIWPRCRYYRGRYFVVSVHILLVWVGYDVVLLVDMGPRYVQPVVFVHVVRYMAGLAWRMSLHRFLMLLLGLPMLWW